MKTKLKTFNKKIKIVRDKFSINKSFDKKRIFPEKVLIFLLNVLRLFL